QHLGGRHGAGPGADRIIQFLLVLDTSGVVGHARIPGQLGPADRIHQPLVDGVAVAADDHELAIGTAVGVGRDDAGQRGPGGLAYDTGAGVFRYHALHQVEHGLVQGSVDDLAPAGRVLAAPDYREQDAQHAVDAGQR